VTMITVMILNIVVIMFFFYQTSCDVAVIMDAKLAVCCSVYLLLTETLLVALIRPV